MAEQACRYSYLKEYLDYYLSCERIACQYDDLHLKLLKIFIINQHLLVKWFLSHSFSQILAGSDKHLCIISVSILNGYLGLTRENSEWKPSNMRESLVVA